MTLTHHPPSREDAPTGRRPALVLLLLATAQLMLVLDVTVVNVALPEIGLDLDLSRAAVPWVMTTYTVCFGGLMLLGGRLADLLGARRVLVGGLVTFTLASLACGLADDPGVLLAGRALQGVGAAALSPAALSLAIASTSGAARTRVVAVWGALSGCGAALGVVLGGLLTSGLGWQWIFFVNVPVGVVVLVLVPTLVTAPSRPEARERLDVPGALLVTTGTAAAIYGLVNAGIDGWGDAATVIALGAAALLWAAFVVVEQRTAQPLLHIGLLRDRGVAAGSFLMVVATGLMVGGFFLGSFTLQRVHGESAAQVGLSFLPVAIAVLAGAHLAGHLLTHLPARVVAAGGLALAAVGNGIVALTTSPAALVTGLSLSALGIGATFVTAFGVGLAGAEESSSGLRSAIVSTCHELGGALGVAVLSGVAGAALVAAVPAADDFTAAYVVATVIAVAGALVAMLVVPTLDEVPVRHGH